VIITDNVATFKSTNMVKFCVEYGIKLRNSTAYYPQGNGLFESSNESVVEIIKKLLEDNKRVWDSNLKYALWDDRVRTKRAIGTSSFQLVYGMEAVIPVQLDFPVVNFLQEIEVEPNDGIRRICQIVELQQARDKILEKAH
jgi:transposase InsO family protein